ncbi:MAG: type II secretion system protein [Luteolibacter sp.]|jgi:prepilin-type N-terminal cleavage/methylation domain-containing protein/prepilin-type processing-associated H-X9-DG protein|nr:type II secretion system protein [Luteolibacter sp.]
MSHPPSNRFAHGFTLMELLVVIVLFGTLSALGFQGFRAARTRANQAVSAANLRQLVAANLLYATDHQTYCPTDLDGHNLVRWHGARRTPGAPFDPAEGLLADYLGESRVIGRCPELEHLLSAEAFNENGSGGYGYNTAYIGTDPFVRPERGQSNPSCRPANVNNPAGTLMFATVAFAVAGGLQDYSSADPPRAVDSGGRLGIQLQPSIHFRFNGKALIGWCDGHVSEEVPSSWGEITYKGGDNKAAKTGFCGPLENNGWWNPRN